MEVLSTLEGLPATSDRTAFSSPQDILFRMDRDVLIRIHSLLQSRNGFPTPQTADASHEGSYQWLSLSRPPTQQTNGLNNTEKVPKDLRSGGTTSGTDYRLADDLAGQASDNEESKLSRICSTRIEDLGRGKHLKTPQGQERDMTLIMSSSPGFNHPLRRQTTSKTRGLGIAADIEARLLADFPSSRVIDACILQLLERAVATTSPQASQIWLTVKPSLDLSTTISRRSDDETQNRQRPMSAVSFFPDERPGCIRQQREIASSEIMVRELENLLEEAFSVAEQAVDCDTIPSPKLVFQEVNFTIHPEAQNNARFEHSAAQRQRPQMGKFAVRKRGTLNTQSSELSPPGRKSSLKSACMGHPAYSRRRSNFRRRTGRRARTFPTVRPSHDENMPVRLFLSRSMQSEETPILWRAPLILTGQ